jgi:glutamate/tyrosine decarboxylase-like PLP-dependent enzyme
LFYGSSCIADKNAGHKWLNVPYDCGLFYTRSPQALPSIFAPAETPAYLSAPKNTGNNLRPEIPDGQVNHELVPSPLYVNIENSRRFRALPLLASLMSLGKDGYRGMQDFSSKRSYTEGQIWFTATSPSRVLSQPILTSRTNMTSSTAHHPPRTD